VEVLIIVHDVEITADQADNFTSEQS